MMVGQGYIPSVSAIALMAQKMIINNRDVSKVRLVSLVPQHYRVMLGMLRVYYPSRLLDISHYRASEPRLVAMALRLAEHLEIRLGGRFV